MKFIIIVIFFSFLLLSDTTSGAIPIVTNNLVKAKIILPKRSNDNNRIAAEILQKYIYEITSAKVTIGYYSQSDNTELFTNIFIGDFSGENIQGYPGYRQQSIEHDGYLISSNFREIFLVSKVNTKGVIYGVYTILEDFFNCRMFSAGVKRIPKSNSLSIPNNFIKIYNPAFQHRTMHMPDIYDEEYRNWHRVNFRDNDFGKVDNYSVHTLTVLLPKSLFKNNSHFFAFRNGKRNPEHPCLSSESVYQIVERRLEKEMQLNPGKKYWSVSQPDNSNYCQCKICLSTYSKYGDTPQATILLFGNRLAKAFPNKVISVLAYTYSVKPPVGIVPRPNLNVMLCDYNTNKGSPIDKDLISSKFYVYFKDWCKLTSNIFMWHYIAQYTHLLDPYPNYTIFDKNLRLFKSNNFIGVYGQGSGALPSELNELKTYLFSKLLWDPYVNEESIIKEFVDGYYGNASVYIYEYLSLLNHNFSLTDRKLRMMGISLDGANSYLSMSNLLNFEAILDIALLAVKKDSIISLRVKKVLVTIKYAILQDIRETYLKETKARLKNSLSDKSFKVKILSEDKATLERLSSFIKLCEELDIRYLNISKRDLKVYKSYFDK